MKRRRFLMIAGASALVPIGARAERLVWRADALGGEVSVELLGPARDNRELADALAALVAEIETSVSLFRPDSALSILNRDGRLADPPRALVDLMALADEVWTLTGGLFDPTVQPLWQALARGGDPTQARRLIGWPGLDGQGMARLRPGQQLTFNGIAQGYAADRAKQLLMARGYRHALVDLGEFTALGGPFTLGIEDPAFGQLATRRLGDGALATSSPAAMSLGAGGHILGPRNEAARWSTVSVEAESAALADGVSTALCLADPARIAAVLTQDHRIRRVLAISPAGDLSSWEGG